ncbi:MAG TPA: M48 family metalloprotease [Acidobacteriota bacterium]|nr:M48 family metalloprotease [Acidobacteriota bacterium]HQF87445.1 M48 family metalloprotease [Acidobacteriota bacterium]HQG92019.1 M48 family metalloprotease [Acidobacteriota bacterium]
MSRRHLWLSVFVIGLLVFLPVTGAVAAEKKQEKVGGGLNFFSEQQEKAMGKQYSDELKTKLDLVQDSFVYSYINQIGQKLAQNSLRPDIGYEFQVVNTGEINAFALPGGYIYINRGLINTAGSESEVAGVIGHEIAHVVGRHSTNQMSKQLLLTGLVMGAGIGVGAKSERWGEIISALGGVGVALTSMKFSRDHERQADKLGMATMVQSGYDPGGMISMFQRLNAESMKKGSTAMAFMSTHPLPAERVKNMEAEVRSQYTSATSLTKTTRTFDMVKERMAAMPMPPPQQEKTLSAALASLDQNGGGAAAGGTAAAPATKPVYTGRKALAVPGDTAWLDTGIDLVPGQVVEIMAKGQVYYKRNSKVFCDPDGAPGTGSGFWKPIPKANTGALIGRIGDNPGAFVIGSMRVFQTNVGGRLALGINDDNATDNLGGYQVYILVR